MEKRGTRVRFAVLVVVVLAVVASVLALLASHGGNDNSVKRIILTPVPGTSGVGLEQKLRDAAVVLRLRVAAVDKRAQVLIEDNKVVLESPGADLAQLRRLGSPGQLEMRPVLAQTADPTSCSTVQETSIGALDRGLSACSQDGATGYTLGPARLTGSSVAGADANDAGDNRQIVIHLTPLGQKQFTQLTRELVGKPVPRNELAIVVDGVVLSAPEVQAVIIGDTQISGDFSYEQAQALAVTIRYGGLPLGFSISEG